MTLSTFGEEKQDWRARWAESGSTWKEKWTRTLDAIDDFPENERIEILASASKIKNRNPSSEEVEIAKRGQMALIAIPGHAKFFTNRLEQVKKDMLEGRDSYFEYTKAQEDLSVLAFLPSAETVSELGKLIDDPIGRDGKILGGGQVWEGDGWLPVNCQIALSCFEALPIENGPKLNKDDFGPTVFTGVDKWKDWWNEVKSGKRTYRFVGSPIEYGPEGPVPAKELQRRERERAREATTGHSAAHGNLPGDQNSEMESRVKWPAVLAASVAGLMLLLAGWRAFLKPRSLK